MPLTSLKLQNFTAFAELDLAFSPGVCGAGPRGLNRRAAWLGRAAGVLH